MQGWDEWKKQILELPENRDWSTKELNEWLASGGAFHELPAVLTEKERDAHVREMIRSGIVKKSPVERAAPLCAKFIDAFQLERVACLAYRTDVITLPDNPSEMTCFFASLVFASGLSIKVTCLLLLPAVCCVIRFGLLRRSLG